ncbi:MAG TPA: S1-like domain-containing RNA-binding protein [Sediminibacterium sp.]|jgi:predicted RNA-binding protein (virulence factor B family)|uniref:CvfB family protein n=1 Tax=Sediminibacterium sp. TaxID=1917865 RepID=UPI001B72801A|nr:S1-like domain-containing RNA-binding protein [Sediminibacterium sp.]MBP7345277.1 RNA-binding protein [Sediminibacterium sp.]HPH37382.1 S1-like domain-containing RNA-binding protein [Sediminibacterium sp.]
MEPVKVGQYNRLRVNRKVEFGFYLEDGAEGILLPKRFAPNQLNIDDEIEVFVYHDSDNRLIATTQKPKAVVGEIAKMKVVSVTKQGAFLDWGLMKDLFVPASKQVAGMRLGGEYLVMLYIDEMTGRVAATEKVENLMSNDALTVKEMEAVDLLVYRTSELGYVMIINNKHIGILHGNEVFQQLEIGDKVKGFIKKIRPDNKIDLILGKPGYTKVEDETAKVLRLLAENNGYLPYNDKSDPTDIYAFFGMSKKAFKMTTGNLYKQKKIQFTQTGIQLIEQ